MRRSAAASWWSTAGPTRRSPPPIPTARNFLASSGPPAGATWRPSYLHTASGLLRSAGTVKVRYSLRGYLSALALFFGRWFFRLTPCSQAGALRDWLHKLGLRPFDGPRYITLARPAAALPPHPTRLRVRAVPPAELRAWQMFLLQLYGEYAGIYLTTIGRDDCTHFLAFDGDRPVAAAGLCVTGTTSTVRHLDNARGGVHSGCLVRWRLEEIHRDTSGVSRRLVGPISVCGGGGNDNE